MGYLFFVMGLGVFIGAFSDSDRYWKLTKAGRRGFPYGRKFTRIFHGVVGLGVMFVGLMIGSG